MILLWLVIGLVFAIIIARLNESNKLFWIMFISFMTGVAGGYIYKQMSSAQSKSNLVQVNPTQESTPTLDYNLLANVMEETQSYSNTNLVSKDTNQPESKLDLTLSSTVKEVIENPPQYIHYDDTS